MVFNRWRRWRGKVTALPQIEAIAVVAIAGFMLGSLTLGADALGLFQALELKVFDRMIRLRQQFAPPVSTIDDRLLIVGITDEDIQLLEHYPVRDEILADALAILQRHNPAVMGLDLYRDVPQPPGRDALMAQIQQHQVGVTKIAQVRQLPTAWIQP